jgi:hypothetical protein
LQNKILKWFCFIESHKHSLLMESLHLHKGSTWVQDRTFVVEKKDCVWVCYVYKLLLFFAGIWKALLVFDELLDSLKTHIIRIHFHFGGCQQMNKNSCCFDIVYQQKWQQKRFFSVSRSVWIFHFILHLSIYLLYEQTKFLSGST